MASQLASLREASKTTDSSRVTYSQTSKAQTSMSTHLEHDFTVEGKKGPLQCPFTKKQEGFPNEEQGIQEQLDQAPHDSPHPPGDPICAAMFDETTSQAGTAATAGGKCPIRYMDKHSPAEIAAYVETHKHDLPRSHEVCLRRYQRNEQQIRKLDSKYGNVVSMIEGLSQLHQPMLPEDVEDVQHLSEGEGGSNKRVESWAHAVSATTDPEAEPQLQAVEPDRESHFDRPLKEVRVGESPSRPWGISVPVHPSHTHHEQAFSPPPAPVRMPSPAAAENTPSKPQGKCPFDHTKLSAPLGLSFDHERRREPSEYPPEASGAPPPITPLKQDPVFHGTTPGTQGQHQHQGRLPQPTFINPGQQGLSVTGQPLPQMVFTGPVFIGYPIEQAMQFMNQYRGSH